MQTEKFSYFFNCMQKIELEKSFQIPKQDIYSFQQSIAFWDLYTEKPII